MLALLAGLIFAGPPLAARIASRSLDLQGMKQLVIQGVKSQTNLELHIQGSRFDLYQGIIFSGVRGSVEDKKGRSHFLIESENAVLTLSYWKLLQREFPVEELVIHQGRLDPIALELFEWKEDPADTNGVTGDEEEAAPENATDRPGRTGWSAVTGGRLNDNLDFQQAARQISLRMQDLEIKLQPGKARQADNDAHVLILNLEARPAPDGYQLQIDLEPGQKSQGTGQVRLKGRWDLKATGRPRQLNVAFEDVSIGLVRSLMLAYPALPADLRRFFENWRIGSGSLQGQGSIAFEERGNLLKLSGEYNDLDLRMHTPQQAAIKLADAAGTFQSEARFPGIAEPDLLEFSVAGPGLELRIKYEEEDNPEIKRRRRERSLSLNGGFKLTPELTSMQAFLLNAPLYGNFDLKADARYQKNDDIIPELQIAFEDIELRLPAMFTRAETTDSDAGAGDNSPRLTVTSGQATQKDEELSFQAAGDILGFPYQVFGEGSLRFDMITWRERRVRDITADLDVNATVREVEYAPLARIVARIYKTVMTSGTAPGAQKAEDGGPLFKLSFDRRFLYKGFLKPLKLDAEIVLKKKPGDGGVMPDRLEIEIFKRGGQSEFKIPTQRSDNARIYYRYQLSFYNNLPRHEQSVELYIKNNTYALPGIFGTSRPPDYVEFYYAYKGDGWFPYDLIHWSHSNMRVYLEDVTLGDTGPFRIIRHGLRIPGKETTLKKLRYERITQGRDVDFRGIRLQNDDLEITGSGNFDLPNDGSLKLSYEYRPDGEDGEELDGRMRLKLGEEGKWIPASL